MADSTNINNNANNTNGQSNQTGNTNVANQATVSNTNATVNLTAELNKLASTLNSLDQKVDTIEKVFKAFETAIKALGEKVQDNTNSQNDNKKGKRKKETEDGFSEGLTTKIFSKLLPKEFSTGLKHFSDTFKKARAGGMDVGGSAFKALGPAALYQGLLWGIEAIIEMATRGLQATATTLRAQAIAPNAIDRRWSTMAWLDKMQQYRKMGYKDSEIQSLITSGYGKGMDETAIRASAAAQKYYGLQGADDYALNMMRRAGIASSNLAKAFSTLRVTANAAGMGMQEMSDFQKSYMGSVKGGGFNIGTFNAMVKELSPLIKTGQITGSELAGLMDITHRTSPTQLMAIAQFAKEGGYKFKSGDNLLANAYELRRMKGGDLDTQIPLLKGWFKGVAGKFGASSFSKLPWDQREIMLEDILPRLNWDISKLPNAPDLMKMIEENKLGNTGKKLLEEAAKSDTDRTNDMLQRAAQAMSFLAEPVVFIKELLWEYFTKPTTIFKTAKGEAELREKLEGKASKEAQNINLKIMNATKNEITAEAEVAGSKANVKTEN